MQTQTRFIRRDPAEVQPRAKTCGAIRCLIEESDGAAAEVHHVEIQNAKLHYHERTDEFYYVIDGQGTMILDETEIELHTGVVVYIARGQCTPIRSTSRLTSLSANCPGDYP